MTHRDEWTTRACLTNRARPGFCVFIMASAVMVVTAASGCDGGFEGEVDDAPLAEAGATSAKHRANEASAHGRHHGRAGGLEHADRGQHRGDHGHDHGHHGDGWHHGHGHGHGHHDHDECDSDELSILVDTSLRAEAEDYVEPDGLRFEHGRIVDDEGANDFVLNQLILYDIPRRELRRVLRRWNGSVARELDEGGIDPAGYLVEVDPSTAEPGRFERDLERILGESPTGTLTFSSPEALATFTIAAAEAADGVTVGINMVMPPAGFDNGRVLEGPEGARSRQAAWGPTRRTRSTG